MAAVQRLLQPSGRRAVQGFGPAGCTPVPGPSMTSRGTMVRQKIDAEKALAIEQYEHSAWRSALPLSSPRGHRGALARRQGGARGNHCLPGSGLLTGLTWDRVGSSHCSFAGNLWCGRQPRTRRAARTSGTRVVARACPGAGGYPSCSPSSSSRSRIWPHTRA